MISSCGCDCGECISRGTDCKGCQAMQGKPYWVQYVNLEVCPLFKCCKLEKKLDNCGECDKLPCELFWNLKDPSNTDEEHLKTINDRVAKLKDI